MSRQDRVLTAGIISLLAALGLMVAASAGWADSLTQTSIASGQEPHMGNPKVVTIEWVASSDSTLTSPAIDLWALKKDASFFGLQYLVNSAMGTVNLTSISATYSNDGSNYAAADGASALISSITTEAWKYVSFSAVPSRYIKFSSVTAAASSTDTTVTVKMLLW